MRFNRFPFLIISILVSCISFYSQNSIAKEAQCTDKKECFPESSSTWNMIDSDEIVKKKKKLLKEHFNALIKHKSLLDKKKLMVKQQASWLNFAQNRCEFIGDTSGAGGHWPYVQTNNCLIKHYDSRIDLMKSTLKCLMVDFKDVSSHFGYNHCIDDFHQIMDADRGLF
jgi:uncharacterized protein YecT (DUF1311 family)